MTAPDNTQIKDMALTKVDITERLIDELGLHKGEAKTLVENFFEEIGV